MINFEDHKRCSDRLVVVPMKSPSISKSRLRNILLPSERRDLARLLFDRSIERLKYLRNRGAEIDIAVVTRSVEIACEAKRQGVTLIAEPEEGGLSEALQAAADWADAQGYKAICILPADLMAPTDEDLMQLFANQGDDPSVIVCPSRDLGTNALYLSPPDAIPFAYGPRSAVRHLKLAEQRNLPAILWPLASIRDDIDTLDCLERAFQHVPELRECLRKQ